MSPRDQHQCYTTANRALATAVRRGERRAVDYWSGQPVTSIEILPCVHFLPITNCLRNFELCLQFTSSEGTNREAHINLVACGGRCKFYHIWCEGSVLVQSPEGVTRTGDCILVFFSDY